MGIWGNPAAIKKIFYSSWGGAPAPGAPPLSTPLAGPRKMTDVKMQDMKL